MTLQISRHLASNFAVYLRAVIAAACVLPAALATARDWPERAIKLVVAGPAGGGGDVLARFLAQRMAEGLGQAVFVENKAGAGGVLASAEVAASPPDGYTVLLGTSSTHGINPALYAKLPFDPIKDFAPVTLVATNKFVMAVPAASPATDVQSFIALARAANGKLNYGSSGNATTSHLAGALFVSMSGVPLTHIPYKGNGPALTDLIAGRMAVMFDNITAMQAQFKTGTIRPIATTGATRSPILPNVPTVAEQGLKGYQIGGWFCLLVSAKTPPEIIARLHDEAVRVLALPEVVERLTLLGADPQTSTPDELRAFLATEIPRWKSIVQTAGAKLD